MEKVFLNINSAKLYKLEPNNEWLDKGTGYPYLHKLEVKK